MSTLEVRTSLTHPLYVDWLPTPFPGRLGLTIAPGKHGLSKGGDYRHERDLTRDLDLLAGPLGATVLVNLLEGEEMSRLRVPSLVRECERRGLTVLRLPIPDAGVLPSHEPMRALVAELTRALKAGESVVIHCAGGIGRSGTVAGCVLVEAGLSAEVTLALLVKHRSRDCPETDGQRAFIVAHARAFAPRVPTLDAIAGCVLGAAIGDAMGHPTEFLSMAQIQAKYGPRGVTGFELFWERDGARFAPYTDDTQLAECVLRALLDTEGRSLDAVMTEMATRFVDWSKHPQGGHRAPGGACLAGCAALARGTHWAKAGHVEAGGCGTVMRAYPFGLVFGDDLAKCESWAVEHSRLTHNHPMALAASAAMAVGVALAIGGAAASAVIEAMIAAARRQDEKTASMMERARDEASSGVGPEVTLDRLRGWAAHEAIAAAVYVFARHSDDPSGAILEGANTPGDSDSIATLAGALTGARCGLSALPAAWVWSVERSKELRALACRVSDLPAHTS